MSEGIELPTIVVVGDQSSGKSSVLESLAGISLPRGQGICTRVPLVMRLQNHSTPDPILHLEYQGKMVPTTETHITDAINLATEEIAGTGKSISDTPLTLVVKKKGVPDLTMVDLPGITRVPVHGQPDNIHEQISAIIMQYISPKESIILNVLSASVDFTTCESIRMSQLVDKTGERTLAVVTKSDKAAEGLLEKVTADDVNIGLGYVCVRNRIGNETYQEARVEEKKLFESHTLLSKIDRSMVGIPVLAQRLVQIQATSISRCLPDIVKKIETKLNHYVTDFNSLPRNPTTKADAVATLMHVVGSAKESLRKILLRGEFEEFPDDGWLHCTARVAEMLNDYLKELKSKSANHDYSTQKFLMEEISVLEEAKGIGLPNFLPRSAFLTLLHTKVNQIKHITVEFVQKWWNYIEKVVVYVLKLQSANFPQLQSTTLRAGESLIAKMRDLSYERVKEIIEMEKLTDYTSNAEYMETWTSLMTQQKDFMEVLKDNSKPAKLNLKGFVEVDVGHLRQHSSTIAEQAFDMKMRITAYWKIVILRLADTLALHMLFSVQMLVNIEMEVMILGELLDPSKGGVDRMLVESPSVAVKRDRLSTSIKLLRESKEIVGNIMHQIDAYGYPLE